MIHEAFHDDGAYRQAKRKRDVLVGTVGRAVSWKPMAEPRDGTSVVMPLYAGLGRVLIANLKLLERQELAPYEVIVVSDQDASALGNLENEVRSSFTEMQVRFVYPGKLARTLIGRVKSYEATRWLLVATGLAEASTRYVLLHELDALLTDGAWLRRRCDAIAEREDHFLGWRPAVDGGLTELDGLADGHELLLDAANLRARCSPADGLEHVTLYRGRRMALGAWVYPQTMAGRSSVLSDEAEAVVWAGRAVEQYVRLGWEPGLALGAHNDVMMLAYLRYVGGEPGVLSQATTAFEAAKGGAVEMMELVMDARGLTRGQVMGLAKQADRLERACGRSMPKEVRAYFQAALRFVEREA